jgi:hypothetical protein
MRQLRWLVHLAIIPAIWIVGLLSGLYLSAGFNIGTMLLLVTLPIVGAAFGLYVCGALLIRFHYRDAESNRP